MKVKWQGRRRKRKQRKVTISHQRNCTVQYRNRAPMGRWRKKKLSAKASQQPTTKKQLLRCFLTEKKKWDSMRKVSIIIVTTMTLFVSSIRQAKHNPSTLSRHWARAGLQLFHPSQSDTSANHTPFGNFPKHLVYFRLIMIIISMGNMNLDC